MRLRSDGTRARKDGGIFVTYLDEAEPELVAVLEHGFVHAFVVEPRAIAGVQVDQLVAVGARDQQGVVLGDAAILDAHGIVRAASDGEMLFVQFR